VKYRYKVVPVVFSMVPLLFLWSFPLSAENDSSAAGNGAGASLSQIGEGVYKIGGAGPAGGIVFYDKGGYSDGWRYLEAAPRDADRAAWGLYEKYLEGMGGAVGEGKQNTQLILEALAQEGETGKAAQICAGFELNGFTDWFLPSKDELDLMYQNLKLNGLGDFNDWGIYLSSSQYNRWHCWDQYFGGGAQDLRSKIRICLIRPVRAF
jgi:hypothetical protein